MSINSEDTFNSQNNGDNTTAANSGAGDFAYTDFAVNSIFAAPVSANTGNEFYLKLKEKLVEVFKAADPKYKLTLLDMDNNRNNDVRWSTILIASELAGQKEAGVAWHMLVLAATNEAPTAVNDTVNNVRITIDRFVSDAVDEKLRTAAKRILKANFADRRLHYAGANVVPANFDLENKSMVQNLAANAAMACGTELVQQKPGFRDLNLPVLMKGKGQIQSITSPSRTFFDIFGRPVRSDLQFRLVSKPKNESDISSLNNVSQERDIVKVSAYVEILYAPAQVNNMAAYQYGAPTQKFAARLVITDIVSSFGYTPGIVMLAIATAIDGSANGNWMQAFRPKATTGLDLNDIGAINVEGNFLNDPTGLGQVFDTKGNDVKLEDIGAFMLKLIHQGLMISVDIGESGPQSWYTSFLGGAAANRVNAVNLVRSTMNELTGGKFGGMLPEGKPLFVDAGTMVQLGDWTDNAGAARDLRDIDYVAAANAYSTKPEHIRGFSDTYLRVDFPLNQRLHARRGYINAITNDKAKFTGRANRVTFTAEAVRAIAESVKATGLQVNPTNDLNGGDFSDRRGVATFAQNALFVGQGSFNVASPVAAGGQYMYDQGRW